MNGRRTTALIAASLACAAGRAHALDPGKPLGDCTVETWRSSDGLPAAWVRSIVQSADGYLWIGTQAGLARYGGGPMVALEPPRALEHAADVIAVVPARDGRVWVIPTRGAPACVRDGGFAPCLPSAPLAVDRVTAVHQDAEGAIWLAFDGAIHRFAAGQFERIVTGVPGTVAALQRDPDGTLWMGSSAGLYRAHARQPSPALVPHPDAARPIVALFRSPRGPLWVAADRGLLRLDGAAITSYGHVDGLPSVRLSEILEDRHGNVWLGTRAGLVRFQPGAGFARFTMADGLPDDDVSALFEDREGALWVGTRGGGLVQFTDRSLDPGAGPPSLREQWIATVAEDAAGALWAGTRSALVRWHGGQERSFEARDVLPGAQVLALAPARDGTVWIGTDKGLARWRPHPDPLQSAGEVSDRIDRPVPHDAPVTALFVDDAGVLWIGGDQGLHRLQGDSYRHIPLEEDQREAGEVRGMEFDDAGTLWVSTGGRMLRMTNDRLGRDRSPGGPSFGKVRALHRDRAGNLWAATRDGLVRRRAGAWRSFGPAEGLTGGDFYQVLDDDLGGLWVASTHGVLRVSQTSLDEVAQGRRTRLEVVSFVSSGQRREVGATRTRQPGAWQGRDGRLWFATNRGVLAIDPRRLPLNRIPPTVRIEQVLGDGRPAPPGAVASFPPGAGALELHFAAITLLEPRKAQHRYRLEGFDTGWIEAGPRRVAYYTNLAPGRYRFRVQGSNADGVWNETGDSRELVLAAHFYQTAWFYSACALAVLGLALSFHRMRVAQLRGRYAATFAERTRIARELHDSLLQGMSAALMQLRALRKRFIPSAPPAPPDSVVAEIQEIEEVVTTSVEDTRRFVWDLRDEPGEAPALIPALEELVRRMAAAHDVSAAVAVEGTPAPVPPHVRRALLRVAHEAISNALRHAQPRRLEVRLAFAEGLKLTVHDDGRGFDPAQSPGSPDGHFGLAGMRERAAVLGQFAIASRPGQGTTVEVNVGERELRGV